MIKVSKNVLEEIQLHAEESFPHECCGVVIDTEGEEVARRVTNVQGQLHAQDPKNYPRTATDAYHMDEQELFQLLREIDDRGWRLKAFYHSHPNHDAYFSAEDSRMALLWDEPAYPGAHYLVASVYEGRMKEIRGYTWDGKKREFVCQQVVSS